MQHARLLIMEDDPLVCITLTGWARYLGATVTAVATCDDADVALRNGSFDLVLSDVHLPGNHRLEWVERYFAAEFPPPILLLTGNPQLESALRAANLPVAGYLVKPPDLQALGQLAQRLIGDHRRRTELRTLARETAQLLAAPGSAAHPNNDSLTQILLQLSQSLAAEAGRPHRENPPAEAEAQWRAAIAETISVLEKTKHHFRSKELGQLRLRLEQILKTDPTG